jgi:hypothetical protein
MSDGRNKISLFTKGSFNLSSAIGISFQSDAAGTTKSSYTLNGASIFAGTSYKDNAGLSEFNVGTSNVTGYSFLRLKDNGGTNTNVYISRTGTIILNPDNANAQVRGLALFGGTLGANADRVIAIGSGTSPTTSSIDSFQFWSNDIVAGNAAPHFRTEAGNVVKLYTQAAVTSSQGIADALTNLGLLTGSSVIVTTPTSGPFGISNSSGSYTYYTSFSASVAAAPTGSVVEMFADVVETGSVEVILRNNVNIFGNGHTYTLNNSGLIHAIKTTTSSNISCSINNLTVIRRGSTGSISDNAALSLGVATTGVINCAGSTFINQGSGSGINSQSGIAEINYATAIASTTWGAIGIFTSSGFRLNHSIGYGTAGGFGIRCHNGGNVSNCIGISDSGTGFYGDAGNFSNCTGVSVSGPGFSGGGGSGGSAINCTGRSTSGVGFDTTNGANVVNCTGISVSGVGLTSNITTHNCTGISNSSRGVTLTSSAIAYNITAKSISSYALLGTNTSKIYGGNIISEWNDATGYGIRGNGGGSISSVISNCVIKLANTSSPYLFNDGIAASISMKGNTYTGGAPFNPNLTQAITATQDNQGNIYL